MVCQKENAGQLWVPAFHFLSIQYMNSHFFAVARNLGKCYSACGSLFNQETYPCRLSSIIASGVSFDPCLRVPYFHAHASCADRTHFAKQQPRLPRGKLSHDEHAPFGRGPPSAPGPVRFENGRTPARRSVRGVSLDSFVAMFDHHVHMVG